MRSQKLKRAKLLVVISAFVLSSFALQNPANRGQSAPSQTNPTQSNPGQSVSTQGVPAQGLPASGAAAQGVASQAEPRPGVPSQGVPSQIFGFRDFTKQYQVDQQFLASPSPARAEQHLKILTALPHVAGSAEDKATADHVAKHFDIAGLETDEAKYSVW